MRNQYQSIKQAARNTGFTVIEMLVVLFMMGIISTLFIANYAGLRGPRNLKIGQNELVTSIRKVQSYALSARSAPNGNPVKYYILKFSTATPGQYVVQAIDNQNNFLPLVETLKYPVGISYGSIVHPLDVSNATGSPIFGGSKINCVQVAISLPFGQIYTEAKLDDTCNIAAQLNNAAYAATIANRITTVYITDPNSGQIRSVTINGVTGGVLTQ
jgi:prepilin-type N-terminal cleavage/methylation domain-containing protein